MNINSQKWFVYIIKATNGHLYTGITTDIQRRWKEHGHSSKGAKFFRINKPESLLYLSESENRSTASQAEFAIKKLSRADKLSLINSSQNLIIELSKKLGLIINKIEA